ncbi:MAG TPA: TetR/AcrR family transcriptional regulator [Ktedonobacterales bacterium]|jgi:AcrR family transcriptional regulator
MSPRPDVSEERKAQILNAATAIFARLGFHEARMEDIAKEAGLSKATLYLYFKSKDDIIAAILDHFYHRGLQDLQLVQGYEGSITDLLLMITRFLAAEAEQMMALLPISFEFYALAARREDVRQSVKEYFQSYREGLAALIQLGIERGEFRPVDPHEAAITLAAIFEGLGVLEATDPDVVSCEVLAEKAVSLLLTGLIIKKE